MILKNSRHEAFAQLIAKVVNQTEAALTVGYSERSSRKQGSRLGTKADIAARVEELKGRTVEQAVNVTGITKAVMGSPGVGAAMLRGGARGLGDSRVPNLARLAGLDRPPLRTLIRSPMLSEVAWVVDLADVVGVSALFLGTNAA